MNQLLSITDSLGIPVNVRSFGARGDARKVTGSTLNGQTIICPDGNFTEADLGKLIWGTTTGSGAVLPRTTVEQVVNSTTIIVATAPVYPTAGVTFVLGTDDTEAIRAAVAEVESRPLRGSIYIPAGGYITTAVPFVFTAPPVNGSLPSIVGEGASSTVFYPAPDSETHINHIFNSDELGGRKDMRGFTVDGTHCPHSGKAVLYISSSANYSTLTDVRIVNFSWLFAGIHNSGQFTTMTRCHIEGIWHGRGIYCNGSISFVDSYAGNCGYFAVDVTNGGFTMTRGILDEADVGTLQLNNSAANLHQCLIYAGAGLAAIQVLAGGVVRAVDASIQPFDFNNNATGLRLASGCIAYLTQCKLKGSGTGFGLDNEGTVYDGGNNTPTTKIGSGLITTLSL